MEDEATTASLEPLLQCSSLLEAEVVRGLLESRGLRAQVVARDQWFGRTSILGVRGLTGIHVAVPTAEFQQAREILQEAQANHPDLVEESSTEAPLCPQCGSDDVVRETTPTSFVAGLAISAMLILYLVLRALSLFNVLLFAVFLGFAAIVLLGGDAWRCNACRHRWNDPTPYGAA